LAIPSVLKERENLGKAETELKRLKDSLKSKKEPAKELLDVFGGDEFYQGMVHGMNVAILEIDKMLEGEGDADSSPSSSYSQKTER